MTASGDVIVATAHNGGIYSSVDSGATFTEYSASSNWGAQQWRSCAVSSDGTAITAVRGAALNLRKVWHSTDSGASWSQVATPFVPQATIMSADGTKWMSSSDTLWASSDAGATWTELTSSAPGFRTLAMSADGTRAIGGVQDGELWYSNDAGSTWTQYDSGGAGKWAGAAMSADGSERAVTYQTGGIWQLSLPKPLPPPAPPSTPPASPPYAPPPPAGPPASTSSSPTATSSVCRAFVRQSFTHGEGVSVSSDVLHHEGRSSVVVPDPNDPSWQIWKGRYGSDYRLISITADGDCSVTTTGGAAFFERADVGAAASLSLAEACSVPPAAALTRVKISLVSDGSVYRVMDSRCI